MTNKIVTTVLVVIICVLAVWLYETDRKLRSTTGTYDAVLSEHAAAIADTARTSDAREARLKAAEYSLKEIFLERHEGRLRRIESAINLNFPIGFHDTYGRIEAQCPLMGERAAVILIMGQSNAANTGGGDLHTADPRVLNFNVNDGRCYRAVDPLLGTSNEGANFATQMGDALIEAGTYDKVVLVPISEGGSPIEKWLPGGPFDDRITVAVLKLALARMKPTFVLWAHGEAHYFTTAEQIADYRDKIREIVRGLRRRNVDAPFLMALSTICGETLREGVREAITEAVSTELKIFLGPDIDQLGHQYRRDKCHFNAAGLKLQARMWARAVMELDRP
jgi:hypothetical protein